MTSAPHRDNNTRGVCQSKQWTPPTPPRRTRGVNLYILYVSRGKPVIVTFGFVLFFLMSFLLDFIRQGERQRPPTPLRF